MKYMLMMHTAAGGPYQISSWPANDIKAHIAFMMTFATTLSSAGELVSAEGLSGLGTASTSEKNYLLLHAARLSDANDP
jgi:hypothetical protein